MLRGGGGGVVMDLRTLLKVWKLLIHMYAREFYSNRGYYHYTRDIKKIGAMSREEGLIFS